MCCTTSRHHGFHGTGHRNPCFCGCDASHRYGPRFMTKEQQIAELGQYLDNLRDEAKAVEERMAEIKKGK